MVVVNPDPQFNHHKFLPEKCVTALFTVANPAAANDSPNDTAAQTDRQPRIAPALVQAIQDVDLENVQYFIGPDGAKQLDVDGEKLSGVGKAIKALTMGLADDAQYLERARKVLNQGGTLVRIDAGDDEMSVQRAVSVLKQAGGTDVQHWGQLVTEQF